MLVFMTSAIQPHLGSQNPRPLRMAGEGFGQSAPQVPDAVSLSEKTAGLSASRQVHDALHASAAHIRSLDGGLQGIVGRVRKMADDIHVFKKNFPPFPPGSEERVRLLNSFSAIRKQIARLTIPPEAAAKAAPSGRNPAPDKALMSMAVSFDQLFAAIREQMPALPTDPAGTSFDALLKRLESLLEFIQSHRARLEERVLAAIHSENDGDGALFVEMASLGIRMGQMFSGQVGWQMTVSQVHLKALQV